MSGTGAFLPDGLPERAAMLTSDVVGGAVRRVVAAASVGIVQDFALPFRQHYGVCRL